MQNLVPADLTTAYRLFNIGGTVLVSASSNGKEDVMPAAWACALNMDPCRVTVVVDACHYTRKLIDESRVFALALPMFSIAKETLALGSVSMNDKPDKLAKSGAEFFKIDGYDMPLVKGCAAYVMFKALPEAHVEKAYDLFIGEALAAWADPRVYDGRHWLFENAPNDMSTLHYVAGGRIYGIGQMLEL